MEGLIMKYFVVKPKGTDAHARASREAIRAYATSIAMENPEMSTALREWALKERDAADAADQPPKG